MASADTTEPPGTTTSTATLKRAYQTMERMRRELEEHERARTEPIAVVGIGCRFPGGVVDAETYWEILSSGTDAVREIPEDRWDAEEFFADEHGRPGKMSTRCGGFLDRIDHFDHDFFGISRREALLMDPQQRLTLEVVWEALENAGQAPAGLAGSQTGVFLGVCSNDYATQTLRHPLDVTAYASTGTAHSVLTGRVSYVLDLRGPSVAIDTACSSSLVAVLQACESLRSGRCDLALSGGVNVIASPIPSIAFSQFPGMVSVDGRCKAFDASANGYVRSEGCGVVVLKRLSDAVREGDQVLAVIRGGAVNQDGRSSGVTAPNGAAQRDVLRRALAAGGVEPDQVSLIEAHGTGTKLGDPIEVEALADVYGREAGTPVYLGSGKTNIGHAEAAAGIAGLIKVVLCLNRGAIAPNVHFTRLNPHLSFAGTTFAVPTELTEWPAPPGGRVAGVSSFGFSGTNAHVILAEPPEPEAPEAPPADIRRPLSVLTLSAKSETALAELAGRYADLMSGGAPGPVADVCFSANTGRSHFRHRLAVVGGTNEEIADGLAGYVAGTPGERVARGEAAGDGDVVFLFTGQGPQRAGMARGLYETQPTFRRVLDRCDELLRPMLEVPLLSVLYPADPESGLVNETTYAQPAMFAVQYAMSELWRSWGVEPAAVLGHSFGEYVAACAAGAMPLEDALKLVVERARLMNTLAETGAMAAVFAPEMDVAMEIADYEDRVSIAAVNGPANTVISGEREIVESICAEFDRAGVQTKPLRITTSSHSPLIESTLEPLRRAAEQVPFTPARVPLVSNLTGRPWPWDQAPDADYWCRHARRPVRFAAGISTLLNTGYRNFVEMGPAPILLGLISEGLSAGHETLLLPSLRPKWDDWEVLLSSLARLHANGAEVDWRAFDRDYRRRRVPVPTYAFDKTPCRQDLRPFGADAPYAGAGEEARPGGTAESGGLSDDDLLYELEWRPATSEATDPAPETARTWLVLADESGIGDELVLRAAQRGAGWVRAVPGTEYRNDGRGLASVRPGEPGDLVRLLDELDLGDAGELEVVHLWGLRDAEPGSVEQALRDQEDGCMSAVRAVQALATVRSTRRARLWLVTRGAVPCGRVEAGEAGPESRAPLAVGQATLWGLGRSLQQEHAGLWGGLIDLDPGEEAPSAVSRLLGEIEGSGEGPREDQVAFRDGTRHVARLVRRRLPETPPRRLVWRKDATYLITGGLGGIGLAVARSMAEAGARRLVLAGRTPIPPRGEWAGLDAGHPMAARLAAVREIEALGTSVTLESLDVSDEDAVRAFLGRWDRESHPAIRGVVHAAGVGEVTPLLDLRPADLERDLRPKAMGAWVLDRLFADRPLDFFVVFSSAGSLLSSPFAAGYAAANAFADALAWARRDAGRPGLSINWGIWSQVGMAAREGDITPGSSQGMATLGADQALRVFHRLLRHDEAQIAVMPIDWEQWGRRYQDASGSALLSDLVDGDGPAPAAPVTRTSRLPSREELLGLPEPERPDALAERLRLAAADTLHAEISSVGPDRPLVELGLDSLMAVELRNELDDRLGVSVPISVFLKGASVRDLAGEILERLPAGEEKPSGDAIQRVERFEDVATELLAQLEELPDGHAGDETKEPA